MADIKDASKFESLSVATSASQNTTNAGTLSGSSPGGMTKYNMYYTTSRMNVTLHKGHSSTPALFYMKTVCSLTKILLHLRQGNTKSSPMVAFAKLLMTSRHMQIGKGDYYQQGPENQMAWDDLRREKNMLCRSDYTFSTAQGSDSGRRGEYDWRKDRSKFASTVYECVDKSGRTVAGMLSGGAFNWNKAGEIEVAEDLDEGLREALITSALAIWAMEAFAYQSVFAGYASGSKEKQSEVK